MNTDSFPPQWRESAIEYRKVRTLIMAERRFESKLILTHDRDS
jgi:hypothetical protein